jgi:hypothetical protein
LKKVYAALDHNPRENKVALEKLRKTIITQSLSPIKTKIFDEPILKKRMTIKDD